MLERERHDTILRLLDLHTFITIHDVVESTGASEATIRRDFIGLEKQERLQRVRGGVERLETPADTPMGEPPLNRRVSINREKKRRIARQAASLIRPGETIIIDGGSTTYHMAEFIASMAIKVVTNSFAIAEHLVKHSSCTVILPEGTVNPASQLILSNLSADPFLNYHASKAFMGIEGVTDTILTNHDPLLIQSERAMIEHAQELIILADESKFGTTGSLTLCPVDRASKIITTGESDQTLVERLVEMGIEVIRV